MVIKEEEFVSFLVKWNQILAVMSASVIFNICSVHTRSLCDKKCIFVLVIVIILLVFTMAIRVVKKSNLSHFL